MFNSISVKNRLFLVSFLPLILLTIAMVALIQIKVSALVEKEVTTAENMLLETRKRELKTIVEIAYGTIRPIYESNGNVEEAVDLLKRMEFGEDGYLFGYDGDSVRVFSGSSDASIGKSYQQFKDVNGVYLINDLVKKGKVNGLGKGNEFVAYHFPRLGGEKALPKLSYSIYLDKWDLMIGTGVYIDRIEEQVAVFETQTTESGQSLLWSVVIVTALIFVGLLFISFVLVKSILTPLIEVTESIEKLSKGNGDLTQRLPVRDKHELGHLSSSLNAFLESLHGLILSVKDVSLSVKDEGIILTQEVDKIEGVVAKQHNEVSQVATATTEMSQTAQQVSDNAGDAAQAANQANDNGKDALVKVEESCKEMALLNTELESASGVVIQVGEDVENISAVLQVIESIAEQTNLLALNAAIEAARAGEQGRGFAVVADEVRNLASKTQGSTEEIQAMINKLQSGSRSAVQLMTENIKRSEIVETSIKDTSTSLTEIAHLITTMSDVNTQIAAAAEEQSVVGSEISERVVEISEQTSELNVIALNNAKAAEKVNSKTVELEHIVSQFKV